MRSITIHSSRLIFLSLFCCVFIVQFTGCDLLERELTANPRLEISLSEVRFEEDELVLDFQIQNNNETAVTVDYLKLKGIWEPRFDIGRAIKPREMLNCPVKTGLRRQTIDQRKFLGQPMKFHITASLFSGEGILNHRSFDVSP